MAPLTIHAFLTGLFARVSGLGIQFINPPTHGTDGGLSNPPTYKQDYTINIQWYPGDETGPYDLVLHQVKTLGHTQSSDGEFIMPSIVNTTSYMWLVKTNARLEESTLFFLSVFSVDGDSDTSQYFNIVDDGGPSSSSVASSTTPTRSFWSPEGPSTAASASASTSASASASTSASRASGTPGIESGTGSASTPTSSTTNTPTSTIEDPSNPHDQNVHQHMHNDLRLGHKIGLGIGIPATLALGIAAGWLLFRRHQRKRKRVSNQLPATEIEQYEPDRDGQHPSGDVYEAPSNHILEMDQPHGKGFEQLGGELEDKPAVATEVLPLRYEMEANTVHELHDQPVKADGAVAKTGD